jgi:hypothetical protein
MKAVTLLMIVLSHQGYWFGGQEQTICIQPSVEISLASAKITWELTIGGVRLAHGETAIADKGQTRIKLIVPPARATCELAWVYRVIGREDGKELDKGSIPIRLFPPVELSAATYLQGRRIVVLDPAHQLAEFFRQHKISIREISDPSQLEGMAADIVLVGSDALDPSPFAQAPLLEQAKEGAQVLVLDQSRVHNLGDYAIGVRRPTGICWKIGHPLFVGFQIENLNGWIEGAALSPLQLSEDAPLSALAFWSAQTQGGRNWPADALVAVQSIGNGRIVFCQLPIGDLLHDPRSQMILCNALDYMQTPAEPTLAPSQCGAVRRCKTQAVEEIALPTGD